jgi:UDP-glucose 4,6-dehydratase
MTYTIKWFAENDDKSGYLGNLSSALVAHPTGGKLDLGGGMFSNLEDVITADEEAKARTTSEKKPVFDSY